MKILFVSTEFEEQARGITGIIKSMIKAAKEDGHQVGALIGYPSTDQGDSEILDDKVEHLYLQHYMATGKKNLYPMLSSRKNQLSILASKEFTKIKEMPIQHNLITQKSNIANSLDYVIKIPYTYRFMSNGLGRLVKPSIKKAIKKYGVDLVITGAPMDLPKKDVAPARLVQFVHDTMPIDLLETPAENRTPQKFAKQFYVTTTESDLIFANSEDTAKKVHEVNPKAKVHILYGTASSKADQFHDTSYLSRKNLEKGNYLLFISVLEQRKNLQRLFDAYLKAYEEIKMPLVIVGGKGFGYKAIMSHYKSLPDEIKNNIIFTGFISETDKYALLNNACAFVFPSLYEGLGLPIIEAFGSELPVLTSNRGALPEVGGKAALYVKDPYDVDEIAEGLVKIVKDKSLQSELKKHMPEQIAKFSSEKFNARFAEALNDLK
ncbi:MAG: glycosyltransferase family 1 protein [bacterium]